MVRGQVMVSAHDQVAAGDVYGMARADLEALPRIGTGSKAQGSLADYDQGVALGSELARSLGVGIGDRVKLISPNGPKTAFGQSPRVKAYPVVYIFTAGRFDIDKVRVYLPFAEAQSFFNREGQADEIRGHGDRSRPCRDHGMMRFSSATSPNGNLWTWKQSYGQFPARADDRGQCDVRHPVDPRH